MLAPKQTFSSFFKPKKISAKEAMHYLEGFWKRIQLAGIPSAIIDPERNKLSIFSHLNFFQLLTGLLLPLAGVIWVDAIPPKVWLVSLVPVLVSISVLVLNNKGLFRLALLVYFSCYPVFTCIVYINGINLGIELWFILYGILAVFFIKDTGYMLFAISFSMISYFVLSVAWKIYPYQLENENFTLYLVYQGLAIIYIFYGLYLIKMENVMQQKLLQQQNNEIKKQATELAQTNTVKNKMFSVIGHDLKTPVYALRHLFDHMHDSNMSADEIKELVPDIRDDLFFTTELLENLLHWAKSQMKAFSVFPQEIFLNELVEREVKIFSRQSNAKNITVVNHIAPGLIGWADKDMISLVFRNILANAIKFTRSGGKIEVKALQEGDWLRIAVKDNGAGMSSEQIRQINQSNFFTTAGTEQEQGTGLGLFLCKEFLLKNNGTLFIESTPGDGSIISFTLPIGAEE